MSKKHFSFVHLQIMMAQFRKWKFKGTAHSQIKLMYFSPCSAVAVLLFIYLDCFGVFSSFRDICLRITPCLEYNTTRRRLTHGAEPNLKTSAAVSLSRNPDAVTQKEPQTSLRALLYRSHRYRSFRGDAINRYIRLKWKTSAESSRFLEKERFSNIFFITV